MSCEQVQHSTTLTVKCSRSCQHFVDVVCRPVFFGVWSRAAEKKRDRTLHIPFKTFLSRRYGMQSGWAFCPNYLLLLCSVIVCGVSLFLSPGCTSTARTTASVCLSGQEVVVVPFVHGVPLEFRKASSKSSRDLRIALLVVVVLDSADKHVVKILQEQTQIASFASRSEPRGRR